MKRWIKYTAVLMLLIFPAFCFAGSTRNAKMSGGKLTNLLINSGFGPWSNSTSVSAITGAAPVIEDAGDLVTNGTMEANSNWTAQGTPSTCEQSGTTKHGGSYSWKVTGDSAYDGVGSNNFAITAGKLYKITAWVYGDGTAKFVLVLYDGTSSNYSPLSVDVGGYVWPASWTEQTWVLEAAVTSATAYMALFEGSGAIGGTVYLDDVSVHEVTPGCVAADTLAAEGHSKTTTLDVLRYWNAGGANTYGKGMFLLQATKGADSAEYYNFDKLTGVNYLDLQGQPVAAGCWIYSLTAADNAKLSIYDGVSEIALSTDYVPANVLTWVEVTGAVAANATKVQSRILLDGDTADIAYVSHIILVQGSSIGEGNYSSPPGEIIYCEKDIIPTGYDFSAFSDTDAVMNLEVLTSGKVPKGVKAVKVAMKLADSAPADTIGVWLGPDTTYTAQDIGDVGAWLHASIAGDDPIGANGWVRGGTTGDIWNYIQASGAGTLDLEIRISAIELP